MFSCLMIRCMEKDTYMIKNMLFAAMCVVCLVIAIVIATAWGCIGPRWSGADDVGIAGEPVGEGGGETEEVLETGGDALKIRR